MSRKKWKVKSFDKEKATMLAEKMNISPYAALLLSARGINDVESAEDFFGMSDMLTVDPYDFPDMEKAADRVRKALDSFERIAVYGDYDADGVTATALLYSYLEMQGADVIYYVPDRRTEGYGLSFGAIDKISRMGANLIITVDNGISAVEEAKYIKELGMELVITDHHLPGEELPQACAVVDQHRIDCYIPFKHYAGVGVAYKLVCAVEGGENEITDSLLDFVTIGTIGDVMPLYSENRSIVRKGIAMLNETERPGLRALISAAGLEDKTIKSGSVAFGLVPRINAAGRMGSADRAIKLLLSDDYEEANLLAQEIAEENSARQEAEQKILAEATAQIEENPLWEYDRILVVSGEGWHEGVVGIVASRLVDRYGKPAIVITVDGDTAKGSGRSVEGFSLYDALLSSADVLEHFGGHKLAAGIGIKTENIPLFRETVNKYAFSREAAVPVQEIDFKINPSCVGIEMLDVIDILEPFGTGNPQPVFGLYNMTITAINPIGSGKHLKFTLKRDNTSLTALKFRMTQLDCPYNVGDRVDVAVNFESNEYLGQIRLNILIKNMKMHDIDDDVLFSQKEIFASLMRGEPGNYLSCLPTRERVAQVYKFIRSHEKWRYDNEILLKRTGLKTEDYASVCASVEALLELGTLVRDGDGSLALPEAGRKVNLEDAPLFKRMKQQVKENV